MEQYGEHSLACDLWTEWRAQNLPLDRSLHTRKPNPKPLICNPLRLIQWLRC